MPKFEFTNEPIAEVTKEYSHAIDLSIVTPERNFGCNGIARAVNSIYKDFHENNVVWQPDVYFEVEKIASKLNIANIVDIGCGNGDKLVHYFEQEKYHAFGIDFHGSLALCRENHPQMQWIDCDLTSHDDLSRISGNIPGKEACIFILSDVIEHLTDPRPLIAWVRTQLIKREGSHFVVSTPDRLRLGYKNMNDRPGNDSHVREWSLPELETLFISCGMVINRSGHTRANQFDLINSSLFIEMSCSYKEYNKFLVKANLIQLDDKPLHLLVTTEFSGVHNTGGIGTFIKEQRLTYGYEKTLCLFSENTNTLDQQKLSEERLISPSILLDKKETSNLPIEDRFLKATQQIIFYFPDIETVQYADYQGIGCRIAQAKNAGLLPKTINIIANCHGSTHYLENAQETWFGLSHTGVAEKEKISVEGADIIAFPTEFLRQLYADSGISISSEKTQLIRYPFHTNPVKTHESIKIDTLIFFGKRSQMKGYSLFLHSLTDIDSSEWRKNGITKIIIIGPKLTTNPHDQVMLESLRSNYDIEELSDLSRLQAMSVIHRYAHHAICIMPYLADNHPYALLDVAFSTSLPLMVRAGGVPEIFSSHFSDLLLADPIAFNLREKINTILLMPLNEFDKLRKSFFSFISSSQDGINERYRAFPIKKLNLERDIKLKEEATIIVPVFNTPLEFINDLIFGINNQTLKPFEVIFIDDCSDQLYHTSLIKVIENKIKVPFRIIRHAVNLGLAGARNTGLAAARSEILINIDSDDVPLNDFVRDIVYTLDSNSDCVAAVPYLTAFDENTDFNILQFDKYTYRPLGDGVISSQLDNQLGHANSGFRTNVLREFGGWDQSSKAMWEDWALYLRLTSAGRRIAVIPKIGCLYRVRSQSMLRTYKTWPAMRRLASNMVGLPRYENFRLQAMLRSYSEVTNQVEALKKENIAQTVVIQHFEKISNRASIRAMRVISDKFSKYPIFFKSLKFIGRTSWKLSLSLNNFFRAKNK